MLCCLKSPAFCMEDSMDFKIITSFVEMKKHISNVDELPENDRRLWAIKRYFEKHRGIFYISLVKGKKQPDWPFLHYPTKIKLNTLIEETNQTLDYMKSAKGFWKNQYNKSRSNTFSAIVKKYSEPIYWEHHVKMVVNPMYSDAAKELNIPIHLVSNPKWHGMLRMFVKNQEYREQLLDTVRESIVYAKDKRLAKHADLVKEFRMNISKQKLSETDSIVLELNDDIDMSRELLKWVSGKKHKVK